MKSYFITVLIYISLMTPNIFSCAHWPFQPLYLWNVCSSLCHLKSWAICPFILICMISLIYSEYKSFVRYMHCTYSSQSVQTVFHSKNLINVFWIKLEGIEVTWLGRGRWRLIHLDKPWLWPKTSICWHTHSAVLTSIHRWWYFLYLQLFHLYYYSAPSVSLSYLRRETFTLQKYATWCWT